MLNKALGSFFSVLFFLLLASRASAAELPDFVRSATKSPARPLLLGTDIDHRLACGFRQFDKVG